MERDRSNMDESEGAKVEYKINIFRVLMRLALGPTGSLDATFMMTTR